MFILTILGKIKQAKVKISLGGVTVLQKMTNYQKAKVKLTSTELKKKSAAKNKTGTILGINKKNFEDEELPHELFLTARQIS